MADPVQTSGESEAFNTPLPEDKAQEYQAWKAKYAPNDDGSDYDLQGAFLAGVKPDPERGHFPDTFKKPNHPTFSDQSIWNGRPDGNGGVYQGGKWGEGDSFTEGPTNKKFHSDEDEQNYFKKYEPNSALNQGAPASVPIDSSAPPKWDDIQKTEAYRNLSPEAGQLVFRNWVKDTQGYLDANNKPTIEGETSVQAAKNQQQFNAYVQEQAQKSFGMGVPLGPNGKPVTLGQQSEMYGQPVPQVGGTDQNLAYNPELPVLLKQQHAPGEGLAAGLSHLFTVPGVLASSVWDSLTGTQPGSTALDKGLAKVQQMQRNVTAETPSGVGGFVTNTVPEMVGNVGSMVLGGGAGTLGKFGLRGMAGFAAADASQETYHNALNEGATPIQALQSAGVAAAVTTGEFLAFDGVSQIAGKLAFGENAARFASGTYRPTVGEALRYVAADTAGLGGLGAVGQVAENAADKEIYDPTRELTQGATDAALGQAFFSIVHLPTVMKAFAGNATRIKEAGNAQVQAQANLDLATKAGDEKAIADAQANVDRAKQDYADLLKKTAATAEPPTIGDIQDAKDIVSGEKPAPGANPVDDLNSDLEKELSTDPEKPVTEATNEAPQEPETQSASVEQPASDTGTPEGQAVESQPVAESGAVPEGESSAAVAEQPQAEVAPPIDNTVPVAEDTPEQSTLRQRIVSAVGNALPKTAKIVFSTEHENPAWADPSQPGEIFVNPEVLGDVLKQSDEGFKSNKNGDEFIRRLVQQKSGEEVIHNAQHKIRDQHDLEALHDSIPEEERQKTIAKYGNDSIDASKGTSPEDIAARKKAFVEEHARQIIQRKALGETTEDVFSDKAKSAPLVRYLKALYERVKAHLGAYGEHPELRQYLKNIEAVLKDAGESAEPAKERGNLTFAAPVREGFFSQLEKTVDEKMPNKASAEQIRGLLKGNSVKDDELKWSGVDDYLKEHPTATKTDLQRFLEDEGRVKIEENFLADPDEFETEKPVLNLGKYEQYQLPGGTNYREQVFSLPEKKESPVGPLKWEKVQDSMEQAKLPSGNVVVLFHDGKGGETELQTLTPDAVDIGEPKTFDTLEEARNAAQKMAKSKGQMAVENYVSSHFPEVPNYLAHMRLNDRVDSEGNPGTLIEELQSDRHQRGRELGYKGDRKLETTGEPIPDYADPGVPDAPFRKTWHEFLFRKALNDAVASGKDWIGWTTGETQGNRFDLSKQVHLVQALKNPDGTYELAVQKTPHSTMESLERSVPKDKLPDYVGKDLAQKIFDQPDRVGNYTGTDLKVGGEGMKGFYDKIMPQYVEKYAKKWGVKPEIAEVPIQKEGVNQWEGRNIETGESVKTDVRNKTKIWKLPINDAMRKSVQENGQPLFASKPSVKDALKETGSKLKDQLFGMRKYGDLQRSVNTLNADEQVKTQTIEKAVKTFQKDIPNATRRSGISHYVEAGGDIKTLDTWQKQVEAAPKNDANEEYIRQLEAAKTLTPHEISWANRISKNFALTRDALIKYGIPVGEVQNYITHLWKQDSTGDTIRNFTSRPLKQSFKYAGNRSVATFFDGWRMGLEPETTDSSVILGHYMNEALGILNARKFVDNLSKGQMPDGRPIVSPNQQGKWIDVENPKGKARLILKPFKWGEHQDYDSLDLPAFTNWYYNGVIDGKTIYAKGDMQIHPDAHTQFKHIFEQSAFKNWMKKRDTNTVANIARKATETVLDDARKWIKGTLLGGFPVFHIQQEATGAVGYGVNPLKDMFAHPPDLNDPQYYDMAAHGVQFYGTETSMRNFMEGFSANNSLLVEALEKLPGLKDAGGKYLASLAKDSTEWTFKNFIPRLKAKTYENILARNMARFAKEIQDGKLTVDDVKYRSAYDTNNAYGHLNYADIHRNPTFQHLFGMMALAPDFFEARGRHAISAISGFTGSKANREQFRSFAILGGAMYVLARIANAALDPKNDPHWEPENAFRIVNKDRSYMMRSYISDFQEMLSNTRTFATGRLNPVGRIFLEGASGVNYRGEKVESADIFRDMLAQTVPIPLQSVTRGLSATGVNSPVSPLEQFMGALGIKVARFAPAQQIFPLAKKWEETQPGYKVDRGVYPTSAYTPLKYALEDADYDQANKLYEAMLVDAKGNSAKVSKGLVESINRPFTDSRADDMKFYESLNDHDKQVFDAAVARRKLLIQRFQQMRANAPKTN